jgi:phenylalanyl-tRNA synthetase beta chain
LLGEAAGHSGLELRLAVADDGWFLQDASERNRGWGGALAAERPAWAAPLFGFEIELSVGERQGPRYRPAPTTPPVERDLALVLPPGVDAGQVELLVRDTSGDLLETVDLFDEYKSADFEGRSVAWRLVFRAPERTLKDKEVDRIVNRVLKHLEEQLGVERRQA